MLEVVGTEFPAMGTRCEVVVVADRWETARLVSLAETTVDSLEALWSRFRPESDISRVNRHPGRPVRVSPLTVLAVGAALDAWRQTGGAFDPTVGSALIDAGYDRTFDEVVRSVHMAPSPAPGPDAVDLHRVASTISVASGVHLDLGGIGKGLAADQTVATLIEAGASGAMVNIGGDLRADGRPPTGQGWQIDLDCPGSQRRLHCRIQRGAVCTSSTTRRRWPSDAGPQHHLIQPSSGTPCNTGVLTATVIGATAAACEVLATAAIASGLSEGQRLVSSFDATGVLIDGLGELHELPGFERFA